MRFTWIEEPAGCGGCPLTGIVERGEWKTSGVGRLHQSVERVQFNYLKMNTWDGHYTKIIPKAITMTDVIR